MLEIVSLYVWPFVRISSKLLVDFIIWLKMSKRSTTSNYSKLQLWGVKCPEDNIKGIRDNIIWSEGENKNQISVED